MIINSLTLHNFMSYADARIDLTAVKLACLTGANGAGKSALLDAVSWVLWESARASSDELIRLGQTQMWVDLCFSLEGQVYRVRRARQKSFGRNGQQNSSRGSLDLQVWNSSSSNYFSRFSGDKSAFSETSVESHIIAADLQKSSSKKQGLQLEEALAKGRQASGWTSLTAAGMRETQKRLREILQMDYETFVSSVYLRQGRADEFTMRSANERKQVFADILGLNFFERLQELCREYSRECRGRIQILEAGLSQVDQFALGFQSSLEEMEALNLEIENNSNAILLILEQEELIAAELSNLTALQLKEESSLSRRVELEADLLTLRRQFTELDEKKSKLEQLIKQAAFIEADFRSFEECKELAESFDLKAAKHSELVSRRLELRSQLAMYQGRLEVECEHLKAKLQSKELRRKDLDKSCRDKDKLEESYIQYKHLLEAELQMSRKRETYSSMNARAEELQSMISEARVRLEAQIQQQEIHLGELRELLAAKEEISKEQNLLKADLESIDSYELEFELVEEKGLKIKSEREFLQQQILQVQKYLRQNEEKMHELCQSPDLSSCPLCRAGIVDSKAVLDRYELDNENARNDVQSLEIQIAGKEEEREHLRKQYMELRKKLEKRKSLDRRIGEFNERKAAIERAEASFAELQDELSSAKAKLEKRIYATVETESLLRIKAELAKLDFDPIIYSSFQAQMRSQRHIEMRYQQIQKDLKELDELKSEIPSLQEELSLKLKLLQEGSFGPAEKRELDELELSISELDYQKTLHQEIKQKLLELMPRAEKARDLKRAAAEFPDLQRLHTELQNMLETKQNELKRLESESQERALSLEHLQKLKAEDSRQKTLRLSLEQKKDELKSRKLSLESRISQLEQSKSENDARQAQLAANLKEMSEYNTLADAFGKKGLQAIIIENAIPEIEAEANRLLAKLTDNQMHLALMTQQRSRQGNVIETLDIIIADALGTRSYELYSGGEAFKINFALRVAMSRLLARRSGAKLETLIIDEGFGSQDELSRGKMMQAIASIQADFARIIVVTHINEVKEMFPLQINVIKEEGVSKISMLH
ncbi:MAG: SMC family ATPase [Candidatus Obscuribacterales bacterium]|nr:SMC family ATPase [Candidatus Obscuribacterales bacterium]